MTERDLNEMGVRNGAHRARMISSLVMLREKLNRTFRGKRSTFTIKLIIMSIVLKCLYSQQRIYVGMPKGPQNRLDTLYS